MRRELAGKIALVTRAETEVGRKICLLLADRGAHVLVNHFHFEDSARTTVAEIARRGGSAELVKASVCHKNELEEMFAAIGNRHGGLDVLVNNAVGELGPVLTVRDDEWAATLDIALHGTRSCSLHGAPLLAARKPSAIVNISAIGAGSVTPGHSGEDAAKAVVESLTRSLALEFAPMGIRVNAASADLIDDLTEAVLFLASERSAGINGQTVLADGRYALPSTALSTPPDGTPAPERPEPIPVGPRRISDPDPVSEPENLVAVVGIGLAVPGASSPQEFWDLLCRPAGAFTEPAGRFMLEHFWSADPAATDRTYSRVGGYLHRFRPHPLLQAEEDVHGRCPDEATRWLRHSLLQAKDGLREDSADRTAVYVGAWPGASQSLAEHVVTARLASTVEPALREDVRHRLSQKYQRVACADLPVLPEAVVRKAVEGIAGELVEAVVVDTACSSSLYAADLGVKALLAGECDIAYCGGVEVLDPSSSVMFAKLGGLATDGRVRVFDATATGTLFSDGASMVALKRYSKALGDGDKILGVLMGFGAAADGRGKAMAAPNPHGQRLAITRARAVNNVPAEDVDWIVGHGTGTAAGDRAELLALAELAPPSGYPCSSNKATIGHTGWAAGTVSLIHAVLALEHQQIPAQHDFHTMPSDIPQQRVRVQASGVLPFPAQRERARTVGISAFGFGGTNGHLLVTDRVGGRELRSSPAAEPVDLVLVGWSAHLPGEPAREQVRAWLRGQRPSHDRRFADDYPLPSPAGVRMTPRAIKTVDPCHLMARQVAARFVEENGELWAKVRLLTGVITAHSGVPRRLADTIMRCYAEDSLHALNDTDDNASLRSVVEDAFDHVRAHTPVCNEHTMAGVMPNVIGSRITSRYDLTGVSMTVAAGRDSTLAALNTAGRYLRSGELDLALVLAVNGNSDQEPAHPTPEPHGPPAEGAFLLAIATPQGARTHGWPVLARLRPGHIAAPGDVAGHTTEEPDTWDYLGAGGAVALLRAVERGRATELVPVTHPTRGLRVVTSAEGEVAAAGTATDRYQRVLVASPAGSTHRRPVGSVHDGVVLLASNRLTDAFSGDRFVITTDSHGVRHGMHVVTDLDDSAAIRALEALLDRAPAAITVIVDFTGSDDSRPAVLPPELLRLHDLLLLTVRRLTPRWDEGSHLSVLLAGQRGAGASGEPHPHAALFTGFVKSLAWERPTSQVLALLTDVSVPAAVELLEVERSVPRDMPVVWHLRGTRYGESLVPSPLPPSAGAPLPVGTDSTVLVTGGAGGLSIAMLDALGEHAQPRVWLLGRTDVSTLTAEATALAAEVAGADGTRFPELRRRLVKHVQLAEPSLPTRSVIRRADQLVRAWKVRQACERLEQRFGPGRVRYLSCDIRELEATRNAIATMIASDGRIDTVIHAAGVFSSAVVEGKTLESFRAVRDTKLVGYHHLKEALKDCAPTLWCNIGSVAGTYGVPGDTDYSSGNDFLAACAPASTTGHAYRELTIAFPLWAETGFGADPLKRTYFERQGRFTSVTNEEGTRIFLAELTHAPHGTEAVYIGDQERKLFAANRPGYVRERPAPTGYFLRQEISRSPNAAVWQCRFDEAHDKFLHHHLVDGKPTVPGTLMLEIAAQAAEALCPGTLPRGFRNARFESFIRPFSSRRPLALKIKAETIGTGTDLPRVRVALESDVIAPDGRIARAGRRHFQTEVVLGVPDALVPPRAAAPARFSGQPVSDPYYQPDSPVRLSGIFENTSLARFDDQQAAARWKPDFHDADFLGSMRTPFLLLCAAMRTSALSPGSSGKQDIYVPREIERVDLHMTGVNDVLATNEHAATGITLHTSGGSFQACTDDGTVILRLGGVALEKMGTVGIDTSHSR